MTSLHPGGETKTASKGLKQKNMFVDSSDLFESTLVEDVPMKVDYTSLQMDTTTMTTVDSSRSVSRKYSKRRVNEDDVSRTHAIDSRLLVCSLHARKAGERLCKIDFTANHRHFGRRRRGSFCVN